jgi:site-specific DNA-methyltransferase (adenine-specific)
VNANWDTQQASIDYYRELDAEVDAAEGDGIRARWQFGRALLMERVGKQLPAGRLDELADAIGKSRQEIGFRLTFAARFPTEIELSNAIRNFRSWYRIANEALASTAHLSAEKDEWATPQELFDALDAEFDFTVDVCATASNAKCDHFWAETDMPLWLDWTSERCWMNPPYSAVDEWIAKAHDTGTAGGLVVCLVPSRTDVAWFWDHARHGEVRFLKGRQWFVDDEGNTGPAPFPSAVIVFGGRFQPGVRWYEP